MAEIKRTFVTARMNKDLDERLIPNGEYRDAMNIQIRTTDGDASGTVQNIQGNTITATGHSTVSIDNSSVKTKCIGSVADEAQDKSYFLFASPDLSFSSPSDITGHTKYIDYILEQDSNGNFSPVVVDLWGITETNSDFNSSDTGFDFNTNTNFITASDGSKYRVGMSVQAYTSTGSPMMKYGTKIVSISGNNLFLNKDHTSNSSTCSYLIFTHPKALGFNYNSLVTGINVIDNFLFYTTNTSEPKKINILRCKLGTSSTSSHTKLKLKLKEGSSSIVSYPGQNEEVGLIPANNGDLLEEHITVIRKAPIQAPTLIMSASDRDGVNSFSLSGQNFSTNNIGDFVSLEIPDGIELVEGDYVILTCTNDLADDNISTIRALVDNANEFPGFIMIEILSISSSITAANTEWLLELEQKEKPLFELKFARFGYRYKYNDGEYSSFSPFSEIAFLPGKFDYQPKKGYNLGMVNTLRELKITNILADDRIKPDDINCIDILYKSTDSPLVYVIKTVEKNIDPEWSTTNTAVLNDILITSDMVHKVLPSNQILRSWDNVPRFAQAQEIIGNRLVYGNYVQGYGDDFTVAIDQRVISTPITSNLTPEKSLKSIRSYKFGLVFGDKYGRETPVISIGHRHYATKENNESNTSDTITIPKKQANKSNSFSLTQSWSSATSSKPIKSWMDYVKYYVKETSTEYYNLVMDRWYNAEDGNVWISFASADRNKVDEQTYLILKNENGSDAFVEEEARYKIIAIANEAPDFIKTDGRIRGGNLIESEQTAYNSDNEPNSLMTSLIFGLNNFTVPEVEGKLKVRIKAVGSTLTLYTGYKNVTRLENPISPNSGEIQIDFAFGQEANFPALFVANGDYTTLSNAESSLTYYLEFRDDVVENKPEFDGRFFVKILRDDILESKVLNLSSLQASSIYSAVDVIDFDYIDNTSQTNPAVTGPQKDYSFPNMPTTDINYYDFWESRANNSNVSSIFIDGITHLGLIAPSAASPLQTNLTEFPASGSERGFAKSGDSEVDPSTYDRIYFSAFQPNFFHQGGSVANNEFYNLMTSGGTLFRFRNDPNNSVYRIISGGFSTTNGPYIVNSPVSIQGTNALISIENSDRVHLSNDTCFRASFYTTFRRLDPETGLITNKGINFNDWDPRGDIKHDGSESRQLEILQKTDIYNGNLKPSPKAAIWETEPKDSIDLDLYYEASNAIPMRLNYNNTPAFAPIGSTVHIIRNGTNVDLGSDVVVGKCLDKGVKLIVKNTGSTFTTANKVLVGDIIRFTHADGTKTRTKITNWLDSASAEQGVIKTVASTINVTARRLGDNTNRLLLLDPVSGLPTTVSSYNLAVDMVISGGNLPAGTKIKTADSFTFAVKIDLKDSSGSDQSTSGEPNVPTSYIVNNNSSTGYYQLDSEVYLYEIELPWFNCYSFGNGVESDRIRDDFNAPTIDNGVNVSTVLNDYKVEHRQNGLIYSGIYNPNSSVNNLNEFNMSQNITKDLNLSYGSIQALKSRNADLITFTEDKVLRILANKDALFNADGNTNITATDKVLGQAIPYVGDYGISKNPESLAVDQFRMYFTDKQRGAVLRLSRDGLTPISNVGMRTWFRDNLHKSNDLIGSFDIVSGEYNISLKYKKEFLIGEYNDVTISFNESSKGWVSFKSFCLDSGVSVSGKYFTAKENKIYEHHVDVDSSNNTVNRNTFYGLAYVNSTISTIFNDAPGSVKNFKTLNYEGSEGKKISFNNTSFTSPSGESLTNLVSDSYDAITSSPSTDPLITTGWGFESVTTDMQSGSAIYVKEKEGKWFSDIAGDFTSTDITNIDESELNVQGLGLSSSTPQYFDDNGDLASQQSFTITIDGNG